MERYRTFVRDDGHRVIWLDSPDFRFPPHSHRTDEHDDDVYVVAIDACELVPTLQMLGDKYVAETVAKAAADLAGGRFVADLGDDDVETRRADPLRRHTRRWRQQR